jgi:hypothetical protein
VILKIDGGEQEGDEGQNHAGVEPRDRPFREPDDGRQQRAVDEEVDRLVGDEVPAVEAVEEPRQQPGRDNPVLVVLGEEPLERESRRQLVGVERLPLVPEGDVNRVALGDDEVDEVQRQTRQQGDPKR